MILSYWLDLGGLELKGINALHRLLDFFLYFALIMVEWMRRAQKWAKVTQKNCWVTAME